MERSDDVDPRTSKRASGEEADVVESGAVVSILGVVVEGVAWICMARDALGREEAEEGCEQHGRAQLFATLPT